MLVFLFMVHYKKRRYIMKYVSYEKNSLKCVSIDDLKMSLPDLKAVNKTRTIANWLMNWIDNAISDRRVSYGYLLPGKSELAYALGVSLGTVQNVLKMIEDNDYIFSKQCIGSIIKNKNDNDSHIRKQTSKKDTAEEKIKNYIKFNKLAVGSVLPASRQLAVQTGTSHNTVRSAISALITGGILEYNTKKKLVVKSTNFNIDINRNEISLTDKIKDELKKYICDNFKMGDKLPPHGVLAKNFNVSKKTIHNAVQMLVKENMLLPRRGSYGTTVTNTLSDSSTKLETSIFASARETAFYHYQKIQNKIKKIINEQYDIGSKLPSISEFSQMLDISPNTIRKALNNLAKDGVVRFTRGRYGGTYVIDMPEVTEQNFRWLAIDPQYASLY